VQKVSKDGNWGREKAKAGSRRQGPRERFKREETEHWIGTTEWSERRFCPESECKNGRKGHSGGRILAGLGGGNASGRRRQERGRKQSGGGIESGRSRINQEQYWVTKFDPGKCTLTAAWGANTGNAGGKEGLELRRDTKRRTEKILKEGTRSVVGRSRPPLRNVDPSGKMPRPL